MNLSGPALDPPLFFLVPGLTCARRCEAMADPLVALLAVEDVPAELDGAVVELTCIGKRTVLAEVRIPGPPVP